MAMTKKQRFKHKSFYDPLPTLRPYRTLSAIATDRLMKRIAI